MKNIQVIDGAINCAYDVFAATEAEFALIFTGAGQDIQFIEDIQDNLLVQKALVNLWQRRITKSDIQGIHGTLFYGLSEKQQFYPNKMEIDLTLSGGRAIINPTDR
jgi:hypothetical protein